MEAGYRLIVEATPAVTTTVQKRQEEREERYGAIIRNDVRGTGTHGVRKSNLVVVRSSTFGLLAQWIEQ